MQNFGIHSTYTIDWRHLQLIVLSGGPFPLFSTPCLPPAPLCVTICKGARSFLLSNLIIDYVTLSVFVF